MELRFENELSDRLDSYLSKALEISRTKAEKMIEENLVTVNKKTVKRNYKLKYGDLIDYELPVLKESKVESQNLNIEIVYEDKNVAVIYKPKGMVVHPAHGNIDNTLVNGLLYQIKDLSGINGELRPGIVHRIDKDTSGILIIAKNDKAHLNISEQIKNHQVKKTYIALVRGIVKENEATINMPIGRSTKDRTKMAVDRNGKEAITHFSVIKRYEDMTLLKVRIETGRTHQIRVHLSHIGYPIIGDNVYSNGKNKFNVVGQMLHSYEIEFTHPTTGKKMVLKAELPEYFKNIIGDVNLD